MEENFIFKIFCLYIDTRGSINVQNTVDYTRQSSLPEYSSFENELTNNKLYRPNNLERIVEDESPPPYPGIFVT
jgi:hypothetical protein